MASWRPVSMRLRPPAAAPVRAQHPYQVPRFDRSSIHRGVSMASFSQGTRSFPDAVVNRIRRNGVNHFPIEIVWMIFNYRAGMVHASLFIGLWLRFAAACRRLHRRQEWAYSVFSRVNSFSERGSKYHDYAVRPCTLLFIPTWGGDALALQLALVGWRSQVIRRPVHHLNARTKNFGEDHPPAGINRLLPQPYIEVYQIASSLQTRQYL